MKKIGFNQHYGLHDAVVVTETKTKTRRMEKCLGALYKTEEELGEPLVIKQQVITLDGIVIKTNAGLMALHTNYVIDDEVAVKLSGKDIYRQLQQRYGDSSDAALGFKEMYQGMTFWTNKMFTPADLCLDKVLITGIRVERLQDISEEDCLKEGVVEYMEYIADNGTEKYEKTADAIHWIEGGDDVHGWADQGINYCQKCAERTARRMNKGLNEKPYHAVYSYAGGNEEDSSVFCEECGKPLLYDCLFTYIDDDLDNFCFDSMCDQYLLGQILESDYRDYAIKKLARPAFSSLIDKRSVGGPGTWERNPWVIVYKFKKIK